MPSTDTQSKLLDAAQSLIQNRGYNAFSYKDLAEEIGIRTASIHYHYPTKPDLGIGLMKRYIAALECSLSEISQRKQSNRAKLSAFIDMYSTTESYGAICLCGSLASDQASLPESLQEVVAEYLLKTERWVTKVIAKGIKDGEFKYSGRPVDVARSLVSGLQGGLILSRASATSSPMISTVQRVLFKTLEAA